MTKSSETLLKPIVDSKCQKQSIQSGPHRFEWICSQGEGHIVGGQRLDISKANRESITKRTNRVVVKSPPSDPKVRGSNPVRAASFSNANIALSDLELISRCREYHA